MFFSRVESSPILPAGEVNTTVVLYVCVTADQTYPEAAKQRAYCERANNLHLQE